ncbi:alpha/beta hydrolase [Thioalkalivibrio sp. XN8]|nr:alpha/beta hydrolase [Thioalkalivibrio sp. XN8]
MLAAVALAACAPVQQPSEPAAPDEPQPVSWGQIEALPVPAADHRIAYGEHPLQFGELRLPAGPGPHAVAVLFHGGCWRAEYDLAHVSHVGAALAAAGAAVWTPEYRRVGDEGGGWPGTFEDAAAGLDGLASLAPEHNLDLDRVVLVGHSAGGHLALWLAGRHNLPASHPLHAAPARIRGVVALAGITDLARYAEGARGCNAAVQLLMGGMPAEQPERYAAASPAGLLPLGVPQRLLHGALDPVVLLEQSSGYAEKAGAHGDEVRLEVIDGAGHFDLVAPFAPAWPRVEAAVLELLD